MVTHKQIIGDKGISAVADALWPHLPPHHWSTVEAFANAVKAWHRGDSIPGRYWGAFERAGVTTAAALLAAAEAKPKPEPKRRDAA